MFSGGVESTALLTMINPAEDYVGIVNVVSPIDDKDHDIEMQRKILLHYRCFNVSVFTVDVSLTNNMRVGSSSTQYQPFSFLFAARMQGLTEIWWGCHKDDDPNVGTWKRYMDAWSIMHPAIEAKAPLEKLSKKEQWAMIDEEVKDYVISCYQHHPEIVDGCKACADRRRIYE